MQRTLFPQPTDKTKQYYTLVIDHAIVDGRHVVFEIGGGIAGSGFPEYDLFHLGNNPQLLQANYGDAVISPIRRKMIEQLAMQMQQIYIVNGCMHIMKESLGDVWLQQFSNIRYFNSFIEFCEFAQSLEGTPDGSVVIIDRLSNKHSLREDDYAAALRAINIHIPVLNAGAYRLFDNKVFFAKLFNDQGQGCIIPQTWLIDKGCYQKELNAMMSSPATHFILKLPDSSHARDTIIISKTQVTTLVLAIINRDIKALTKLDYSASKPECVEYFLKHLCHYNSTFIIREVVLPDPVQLGKSQFRCAARSVLLVGYESNSDQFDFVDHVTTYWQRVSEAYRPGQVLTHANIITSDITQPKMERDGVSIEVTSMGAVLERIKASGSNPLWGDADVVRHLPALVKLSKSIIQRIAKFSAAEHMLNFLKDDSTAVRNYTASYPLRFIIDHCNDALIAKLTEATPDCPLFHSVQLSGALNLLRYHQDLTCISRSLTAAYNATLRDNNEEARYYTPTISQEFQSLDDKTRTTCLAFMRKNHPYIGDLLTAMEESGNEKIKSVTKECHLPAMNAYKIKTPQHYTIALNHWLQALKELKTVRPLGDQILMMYSNVAACYRELGHLDNALDCYKEAIYVCKQTGRLAEAEKFKKKFDGILELTNKPVANFKR